jgi:hypothetical protein
MKNFLVIILLLAFDNRLQAQSPKEILTTGNWSLSKPIYSLHTSDTLVVSQKPIVNYGWIQFGNDSLLRRRQTLHYCKKTKVNVYAMMMDYKWNQIGSWSIENNRLEIYFDGKAVVFMISRISSTEARS